MQLMISLLKVSTMSEKRVRMRLMRRIFKKLKPCPPKSNALQMQRPAVRSTSSGRTTPTSTGNPVVVSGRRVSNLPSHSSPSMMGVGVSPRGEYRQLNSSSGESSGESSEKRRGKSRTSRSSGFKLGGVSRVENQL